MKGSLWLVGHVNKKPGIDAATVPIDPPIKMRPCGPAGRPDMTNQLTTADSITDFDNGHVQMQKCRIDPKPMPYDDSPSGKI